ncbi:bifunctional phosphopantothenoylcysteine decarboxylase/phosphopantothenate--cysteine ligase CoaBC [Microvirgula aerodenitrificans]|uniref:Coenzyme A biosynthesis bifunctional protein CoaBC n=1 Tax=Microvirgula aerodenitrificans TaxID=57480 RepID=A0A2U3THE3_9NEIS|nr:bifunctional phosphopantothenoylcysteine decarboxylase/phosphopantothenate--cysteine ligase CoaBC [Microvirgula aerodenitrificans]AVY92832.1 bifunctional phosphopantothenoylcysteine decarboxylase/phosphopantothenate--cysteine ligase CoaBC [Microvirgula aerodenitrificans]
MSRHFLIGVAGGVAAYKTCELVRLLVKAGHSVEVAMTEAATHFVGPTTFQALSGNPVYLNQWDTRPDNGMAHIELTRRADAFLIAPATADLIARLAHGLCDDLISTLAAARTCPLIVAPAMNRQMWDNPPNQRNITRLVDDGVTVFGPGSGAQACGEVGDGRMLEAAELFDLLDGFFVPDSLAGRRVLLTAGPTYEAIDPVRGITNISSGKMGYALARACRDAGAEVTLVSGPTALPSPTGITVIPVQSAQHMLSAVEASLPGQHVFISVAAVADYRVANTSEHKLKKQDGGPPTLTLVENPDILASVAARADAPFCVGFAAESQNLLDFAEQKRTRKRVPLLVANLAQQAMGADDNEVVLLDDAGRHPLPRQSKDDTARAIVAHLARALASR